MTATASLSPSLAYANPLAAIDWLERAFGFERVMMITDADGTLVHSEVRFGNAIMYIGAPWADFIGLPTDAGGKNTQSLTVHLDDNVDRHHDVAVAAGAVVVRPLETQFYGHRTYSVSDPGGHVWHFSQVVQDVTREEAEAASGLTIDGWT